MAVFVVLGLIALVFGFLFLFSPQTLTRLSDWLNRTVIQNDARALQNRKLVGGFLLLASLFLFYAAYQMYR